jgi:hypothetical protein
MSRETKTTLALFLPMAILLFFIIQGLLSGRMRAGLVSHSRKDEPVTFFVLLVSYISGVCYLMWVIYDYFVGSSLLSEE